MLRCGISFGPCPLWVKSRHSAVSEPCPLYPRKRTSLSVIAMSAKCQKRTLCSSFAHTDNRCSLSLDRPAECAEIPGYTVVSANISNTFFDGRVVQVFWTGAKYAVTGDIDLIGAYYHVDQNSFATGANSGCRSTVSSQCAGTGDAFSLAVDWRFAKKFDAYAGFMYSRVNDGLASGFLFNNTINPTAGIRFRF